MRLFDLIFENRGVVAKARADQSDVNIVIRLGRFINSQVKRIGKEKAIQSANQNLLPAGGGDNVARHTGDKLLRADKTRRQLAVIAEDARFRRESIAGYGERKIACPRINRAR